jgi:hypothetical protein
VRSCVSSMKCNTERPHGSISTDKINSWITIRIKKRLQNETVEQRLNTRAHPCRPITVYCSTRRNNPKYLNLQQRRCQYHKTRNINPLNHNAYIIHHVEHSKILRSAHTTYLCVFTHLRTSSDYFRIQRSILDFYNPNGACLL